MQILREKIWIWILKNVKIPFKVCSDIITFINHFYMHLKLNYIANEKLTEIFTQPIARKFLSYLGQYYLFKIFYQNEHWIRQC